MLVVSAHISFAIGTALGAIWRPARHARWAALASLGMRRVAAGKTAKARRHGEELLAVVMRNPDYWDYGNAIYKAHVILGRVALRDGNIDQAKYHLLQAGRTPGSPQLDSFGPNMTLAKELLEAGVRGPVLDFFDLCRVFWEMDFGQLDRWTADVKFGRIPDFGTQLLY